MSLLKSGRNVLIRYLLIIAVLVPLASSAEDEDPIPPSDPVDIPLDGGLSALIAAGIGYGAKKAHDARKKKAAEKEK